MKGSTLKTSLKAFYFLNMMSSKNKIKDKLLEISVQCFWRTIWRCYSWLSLSRTRKGPANLFEIERVRDRERKIGYSLHKGTETLVRDRDRFEIEGVRDRESQLYFHFILTPNILFPPYIRLSRSGIENLLSNSLIWRLLTRFDETADLITVNPSFYCVLEWSFFISHYSTRLYCLLVLYRNFLWNSRLM